MKSLVTESVQITLTEVTSVEVILKRCTRCQEMKPLEAFNKDKYRSDGYNNKCRECIAHNYNINWKKSSYQSNGMTGHWSKYGGARVDVWREDIAEKWFCQSCGLNQPELLNPYIFEIMDKDYIRVCAVCYNDGCTKYFMRMNQTEE